MALLRSAQRPIIVTGGGTIYSEATAALADFADALGIPVVETQAGKGALPWNHPWNAGPVGSNGGLAANRLAREADLVLCVGTRLSDFTTASHTAFANPDVRFVSINVCARDAHKFSAVPLVCDAREGLQALAAAAQAAGVRTAASYGDRVETLKAEWDATVDGLRTVDTPALLSQPQAIGIVNDAAGPRDVVVCAAGSLPGDLLKMWRPTDPKSYHLEYGFSCMGYEVAGALGAKMADPSREVIVMVGDGSYLMLHTEIVTSLAEGVKLIIVLLDNGGFQCIRGLQEGCGSPAFGNELRARNATSGQLDGGYMPIDFAKNAESLGALAIKANSEGALRAALEQAKAADRTTLIEVKIDNSRRMPGFESWWDVPIAEVSGVAGVKAARSAYERKLPEQRQF